jgi:hypothetical protein
MDDYLSAIDDVCKESYVDVKKKKTTPDVLVLVTEIILHFI